jgi:D-alanyl-D-alanine carboxypeptidase/D-alanyl-D-alanine-endopeptidase (penicillin-binding protein 4)
MRIQTIGVYFTLFFISVSCGVTHQLKRELSEEEKNGSYFKGFVLYNPEIKKEIINFNGDDYFTPASNTKLFTFYTAYRSLGDSIKSLEYYKTADSLIIKGTADPTLMVRDEDNGVVEFLRKQYTSVYLVDARIEEKVFGSGWAWDDYPYYYMPEKSLFPIYGNMLSYSVHSDSIQSRPAYFENSIVLKDSIKIVREVHSNKFFAEQWEKGIYEVPFKTSTRLTADLLSDLIENKIELIPNGNYEFKTFYSGSYDSVYRKLLTVSDNFIAEQLLLQVGKEVADSYSVKAAIDYSLENYLPDLPQKPRWVDGSGLSRYNLFTPESMVFLLDKMYNEIPLAELLDYFPVGGHSGTLKNWYGNENDPGYVYAKSGSLSNNYNLSGYLITKKGNVLIFSSMNNHFMGSNVPIKEELDNFLKRIYHKY